MKITIKGHPTRGKEVIQILENLGGKNTSNHKGKDNYAYYISKIDNRIYKTSLLFSEYKHYTLEEFEREFPFKIGDRVITITTNLRGIITNLKENGWYYVKCDNGHFVCIFRQHLKLYKEMKEERNITLTLDKAKEWYKKGGELKEVALQAYSEEELTKVELPKTWEEFCKNHMINDSEAHVNSCSDICYEDANYRDSLYDRNVCPSKKSAEAHLAMIQLEQLRDCWRQGWKPTPHQTVFAIKFAINGLGVYEYCSREFLSFKDRKTATEFLKCFRDLIEKAGDLI